MALGYSPSEIESLAKVVQTSLNTTVAGIGNKMREVSRAIGDSWYSPEAVDYNGKFDEQCKLITPSITACFQAYLEIIYAAGENWKTNTTNDGALTTIDFDRIQLTSDDEIRADTDAVVNNKNGDIVILEDQLADVLAKIALIKQDIISDIEQEKGALEGKIATSFIGGTQASTIEDCFTEVVEFVGKIFDFLDGTGEYAGNGIKDHMEAASEKHANVAQGISNEVNNVDFSTQQQTNN